MIEDPLFQRIYREADWPHGLRCGECGDHFDEGDRYYEKLEAFQDDTPIVVIVCRACDEDSP